MQIPRLHIESNIILCVRPQLIHFRIPTHSEVMIRHGSTRIDPKRRATLDYKKKQFATPSFKQQDYPYRLNLYHIPPAAEIRLEDFEQWAIDRLRSNSALYQDTALD